MAPIWKPQPNEVLKDWLNTIVVEAQDKLTPWEVKFVTDMEMYINNKWTLSQKQEEILERIYAEKTS